MTRSTMGDGTMRGTQANLLRPALLGLTLLLGSAVDPAGATAQETESASPSTAEAGSPTPGPAREEGARKGWRARWGGEPKARVFEEPQQAVDALVDAARDRDTASIVRLLGPATSRSIGNARGRLERRVAELFVEGFERKNELRQPDPDTAILIIGEDQWAFPFPLRRTEEGWAFDDLAGMAEIRDRRIGHNELAVVEVCRTFAAAQKEYFELNPEQAAKPHYAGRLESTPESKDGLYWPTARGEPESPIGPLLARANAAGIPGAAPGKRFPFFGYLFRMLDRQGEQAPGGAMDYREDGALTRGFALLAVPMRYGDTGVQSFLVGADGVVYEKDLGPKTKAEAEKIEAYEPLDGWKPV